MIFCIKQITKMEEKYPELVKHDDYLLGRLQEKASRQELERIIRFRLNPQTYE